MTDCQASVRYGVVAPPTFWPYVTEQLVCLVVGEAAAVLLLFLLLKFRPSICHPETLQRKQHRSLHLALFMMIAGGAGWALSYHRRELHSHIFWCRRVHLQRGPEYADLLTKLHLCFKIGVLILCVWALISVWRSLVSDFQEFKRRKASGTIPKPRPSTSSPSLKEARTSMLGFLFLLGVSIVMIPTDTDPYKADDLYVQGTYILLANSLVLGMWAGNSVIKPEPDNFYRKAVGITAACGTGLVLPAIALFSLKNGQSQCSFWEVLSAQAYIAGTTCVAAEFMPRSTQVETAEKEPGLTEKEESI